MANTPHFAQFLTSKNKKAVWVYQTAFSNIERKNSLLMSFFAANSQFFTPA